MYPNPLSVRTVKAYLKDAACDAGMIGATAVVQSVMGSLWGYLFSKSNRRDYLNFIGELAGRTVSPEVERFATQLYQNNNITYKDGKMVVQVPANVDSNNTLLNDSGAVRQNNHSYDSVNYGSDLTNKFRYQAKSRIAAPVFKGPRGKAQEQNQNNNKINNNVKKDFKKDNKKGKPPVKVNNNKPKNMSEVLPLSSAIDEMCKTGYDFSILSSVTSLLTRIKQFFAGKDKDTSSKAVLQGCYEYLEENGYDAYPIMLDIINNRTESDFSEEVSEGPLSLALKETETTSDEVTLSDLQMFRKCANIYGTLSEDQRDLLRGYLGSQCGPKPTAEYLWDLSKYSSVGVQPTDKRLKAFKVLAMFSTALAALKVLLTTNSKAERIN